ncbi:MAG: GAF domain-containing protein [Chitinophagaceae bacterium]|nr:MAG: GAF domain-containing protein [Chitinophagaceae bacterium]
MLAVKVALILIGGTLATAAQFMPEPKPSDAPWKLFLGVGGAIGALVGGFLVAFVERGTPEMLDNARRALDEAQRYLGERNTIEDRISVARQFDSKRRALLSAWEAMREVVELQMLKTNDSTIESCIGAVFDSAIALLLPAMGISSGENYVISVFEKRPGPEGDVMTRLVERRARPIDQNSQSRNWKIGEGFTGAAWQRRSEVIVSDAMAAGVDGAFYIPGSARRADEYERYRSVASVPIQVGATNDIWGVVTVTSDIAGRFSAVGDADSQANVEAVRAVAGILALLVGIHHVKRTLTEQAAALAANPGS